MAGHDLDFNDPRYVSLEIDLHVCVKPDYFRNDVKAEAAGPVQQPPAAGRAPGLFHPDNFSFGQSSLPEPALRRGAYGAGRGLGADHHLAAPGHRRSSYLAKGELPLGRLEIARLDNDPNFPEHGVSSGSISDGGK